MWSKALIMEEAWKKSPVIKAQVLKDLDFHKNVFIVELEENTFNVTNIYKDVPEFGLRLQFLST
jgi:hypothetical protein